MMFLFNLEALLKHTSPIPKKTDLFERKSNKISPPLDVHSYRDETANVVYSTCPSISAARDLLDPMIDDCLEHPNQRNPTCHPDQSSNGPMAAGFFPMAANPSRPKSQWNFIGMQINAFSEMQMNHLCYTHKTS